MIQILISYFIILYIAVGFGLISKKYIGERGNDLTFQFLIGFFNLLIYTILYSFFGGLNFLYFLSIFFISTFFIIINIGEIRNFLAQEVGYYKRFSFDTKIAFWFTILLSLLYSSSLPSLADNESYYVQTIKWLNEYGLVKGLANLHPFFGQSSGWHLLQAGLNFKFFVSNLNDLNGFLIIIISLFSFKRWETFKRTKNEKDLYISIVLLSFPLLFLFIDSPSPDMPILVIVPLVVYLFIESFEGNNHINLITILSLLAILIKVTVAPILVLLLILLIKEKQIKNYFVPLIFSVISLSCFIAKNIIITGYPLYPLSVGNEFFDLDWKMNGDLQKEYYQLTKMYAWKIFTWEEFEVLDFWDKAKIWINLPRMNGIVNKIIFVEIVIFPFVTSSQKFCKWLYLFFILQFLVFYMTSPQYRFFLPILLSMTLLMMAHLFTKKQIFIKTMMGINLIALLFVGLWGIDFSRFSNNKIMTGKQGFRFSQIFEPCSVTQFVELEYKPYKIGNLKFYSPERDSLFFWQTSDGELPCVNKEMIYYYSEHKKHIPQMRGKEIKEGFLSSKKKEPLHRD